MAIIKFKRGSASPPALAPGEPGWCIDTGELYVGTNGTVEGNILVGSSGAYPEYDEAIALIEGRLDVLEGATVPYSLSVTTEDVSGYLWDLFYDYGGLIGNATEGGYIKIDYGLALTVGGVLIEADDTVLISLPCVFMDSANYTYCGPWKYKGVLSGRQEFRREAEWFEYDDSVPSRTLVIVRKGDHRGRISVISSDVDPFVVGTDDIYVNTIIKSVAGGNIYIQETEPASPQENDIWFDLSML
jgi:hypothetical protein